MYVYDKCTVILTWSSGMNYLAGVNRLSELIRENKLESKMRNENYCKTAYGVVNNHQFIMPKSKVDYYDGNDVHLNIPSELLSAFEMKK
jgi:hypothetical protein